VSIVCSLPRNDDVTLTDPLLSLVNSVEPYVILCVEGGGVRDHLVLKMLEVRRGGREKREREKRREERRG
jgi:hypothetical protein